MLLPAPIPDVTIDALYALTDCQYSISMNARVIVGDKPIFTTVDEMLRISTENTKELLRQELLIGARATLNEKFGISLPRKNIY
ncbi:MAG: hypothetical protein U0T32_01230 [Chitinophagales bacterium]